MAEEKKHKPTAKKLEEGRKDGKVLKATLFSQVGVVTVCILGSFLALKLSLVRDARLLQYTLTDGYGHPALLLGLWAKEAGLFVAMALTPAALSGLLIEFLQVGFKVEFASLRFKSERLNPASGLGSVFSGVGSSWQLLFRLAVFSPVAFWFVRGFVELAPQLIFVPFAQALQLLTNLIFKLVGFGAAALTIAGLVEYLVRRKQFLAEMSMSDEEMRREYRESEGDPQQRSLRRALHESLLMQNIAKRVRKSKVIVVEKA